MKYNQDFHCTLFALKLCVCVCGGGGGGGGVVWGGGVKILRICRSAGWSVFYNYIL